MNLGYPRDRADALHISTVVPPLIAVLHRCPDQCSAPSSLPFFRTLDPNLPTTAPQRRHQLWEYHPRQPPSLHRPLPTPKSTIPPSPPHYSPTPATTPPNPSCPNPQPHPPLQQCQPNSTKSKPPTTSSGATPSPSSSAKTSAPQSSPTSKTHGSSTSPAARASTATRSSPGAPPAWSAWTSAAGCWKPRGGPVPLM